MEITEELLLGDKYGLITKCSWENNETFPITDEDRLTAKLLGRSWDYEWNGNDWINITNRTAKLPNFRITG
jgi:hypothetical protein